MQLTDPFGWVGSLLDHKFAIEAVVGEGGFGVVYRGMHLGFELPIAVKCLRIPRDGSAGEQSDLLSKFREEARLLHQLSRRTANIVQALDLGAATAPSGHWTPYIVMEWLEGETLASDLARRRASGEEPRGLDEAIRLLAPAAAALVVAHEERVSHRDIKPANLFLARSTSSTTLKVLDFGIAKVLSEATLSHRMLTRSGAALHPFTPQYGAPEQFSERFGTTGPWTDVFAMALVLIELVTGQTALAGSDVMQLFVCATEEHLRPSLSARGVSASPAVEAVLSRALAASPLLRFRDMGEMWAALTAAHAAQAAPMKAAGAPDIAFAATQPHEEPPLRDLGRTTSLAAAGENRVCTVMFVDLMEAQSLSARLDREDVKEIVDRCFAVVKEQVEAMGGVLEELSGSDRAMALFGVPWASDNDAERAVLAALRLQAALARIALPRALRSTRLSARIGIATGRVFAEPGGGPARQRITVIGDAVNAASKLQQGAPKGAIVIGRDTHRQVIGRFNVAPLAPVEIPDQGEALPVYQVRGVIAFRPVMALSDFYGVETKLVGRVAEMQRLNDALDTMLSERRAGLVTLVGAPGVGRSRMLATLFSSLLVRREEFMVLVEQGSPLLKTTSYGLIAAMIRRRFDILENDAPGEVKHKIRRGMRWLRLRSAHRRRAEERASAPPPNASTEPLDPTDLDDALDQMAAILGARSIDRSLPESISLDDAGNQAKQRILAAAARLLRIAAGTAPIVLFCDDIQWADSASLDLLDELLLRAEDLPVLAVCAARPELFERLPAWSEGKAAHTRIDLAPLARRHMEEMVRDWLCRVPDLSLEVVRTLADRAEGRPLILVETLHLLVDAGVVDVRGADAWGIHEEQLGALALPTTVQGIVQARLDRLEAAPRSMLAQAAVVGRTFWEGAVERLQQPGPRGAPDAAPTALLARLRHRQLIRPREPAMFPGEHEYVFAESAMYEVAYETLSAKIRRPLHLIIATWLEERASGNAGNALVALHYDRGDDPKRAAAAYRRAAAYAVSLGENAEALRQLERARDLHDEAQGDAGGDDASAASWRDSVCLRLDLGDVLRRLGRLDEAERTYAEARALIPDEDRSAAPSVDMAEMIRFDARIDHRLAVVYKVRGATKEARMFIERAIAGAKESGAIEETPAMYALLAFLHRRERHPEESWRAARQGLWVCRALDRRDARWQENVTQLLFGVAAALFGHGRIVSAERSYRQSTRVISEASNPYLAGIAWNGVGAMRFTLGDWKGARAIYLRALRLKERAGDLHQIAVTCTNLAEVELLLNDLPAALDHAHKAVRLSEQAGAGSDLAAMYRNLADVLLAAGQLDEALTAGRKALATAEVVGRVYLGESALTLARACWRAAGDASSDAGLRARAEDAKEALLVSLSVHFNEVDLLRKAEECQAILAQGFKETH